MDEAKLKKLLSNALQLERGCNCGYDYRCGNCDRIITVQELAEQLINESDTDGSEAVRPD